MQEGDRVRRDLEPGGMTPEPHPRTDRGGDQRAEDDVHDNPSRRRVGTEVAADERGAEHERQEAPQDVHPPGPLRHDPRHQG